MVRNLILAILILFVVSPVYGKAVNPVESHVTLSVFVGKHRFFLYGYTSPDSVVYLNGQGIAAYTRSNNTGYFEFAGIFSPFSKQEVCLVSFDNGNRRSYPTCLPPFPIDYQVRIGPVIMAPTISTNHNNVVNDTDIVVSGQSIPDSQVDLAFFSQTDPEIPTTTISMPKITAHADSGGNYSVLLPKNMRGMTRTYSQTTYQGYTSPNSNRLNISIISWWWWLLTITVSILKTFNNLIVILIILTELMVLFYFLHKERQKRTFKNYCSSVSMFLSYLKQSENNQR